jgi:UDP:flavonoid glycosyltransferase YjiC (YdhE family)
MGPLIDRAGLVVTNGTSAPVLAGLLRGRPLVVSPAGSEQPLLAAACVRAGVAVAVPGPAAEPAAALHAAWHDAGLRARAAQVGRRLAGAAGASGAADAVQRVAAGGQVRVPKAGAGRA